MRHFRDPVSLCTLCSKVRLLTQYDPAISISRGNVFRAFEPKPDRRSRQTGAQSKQKFIKNPEDRDYELSLNPQPREERMPVDQDWTAVWPTAQVFRPSVVPLPIRMGKGASVVTGFVPPSKYANVELLKINNFLHLTPPAVEKHCNTIKKFMTKFPEELKDEHLRREHFPLEITTSDFCFSGPAVRHPDSRICTLKINLTDLNLEERARNKLILLLEDRYDVENDTMTIVTDRCPTRKQNRDYAIYLLTVLYHESNRVQPFEESKSEHDDEKFIWDRSKAKAALEEYLEICKETDERDSSSNIEKFGCVMTKLVDEGETQENLEELKNASIEFLELKPFSIEAKEISN